MKDQDRTITRAQRAAEILGAAVIGLLAGTIFALGWLLEQTGGWR